MIISNESYAVGPTPDKVLTQCNNNNFAVRHSGVGKILVWRVYQGAEGAEGGGVRKFFDYFILKWRILMHISGILTYLF